MGRYYLDEDEKRIARAVVRINDKKQRGKIKRRDTSFDKRAAAAIERANEDIDINDDLLDKVRHNIISGTPWERIGETYCGRDTFYRYARHYLYYVARAMGIVDDTKTKRKGSG